ncbi:hypothetical protein TcasGA2_TC004346 [Tribolium castaneum]|uniref:Phospholipase A2-like domain-containing protein n=1 Tax=Tribolium castaneum TaxID=7070 RepID=D7ELI9_TRICA|nr:hypothetical protein TcasGA2_TC004346 [Tribolium castaneum]
MVQTRRNSSASTMSRDDSDDLRPRGDDVTKIIEECAKNLDVLDTFILKSKECISNRQTYQESIQKIHAGLRNILVKLSMPPVETNLEKKITNIVEKAIGNKMGNMGNQSLPTGYSQILKRNSPKSHEVSSAPTKLPQSSFKVIIKPNESLKNVKSSKVIRKILMSKTPKDFGIKVNKMVPIRNNAILIESSCSSILNLTENAVLKSLNLCADRINKVWPKIQIFDVPKDKDTEQLVAEILNQEDLPDSIPEKFVKSAFKVGNKEGKTNHWVVEMHPAARSYFTKSGRIYISWKSLHVRDYLRVTRCFKCQKFGHVSKFFNSEKQCGYCASTDHESNTCKVKNENSKHKCSNCERAGQQETNHSASIDSTLTKRGWGLINKLINKLPIELHIPGYQFCGPGTKLQERIALGHSGRNKLDQACKEHDVSYANETNLQKRHEADKLLLSKAVERLKAKDASFGEKAAALAIAGIMKGKVKFGMGAKSKKGKKKKTKKQRILVAPKYGGFLPFLLPLLGALGALGGGAAGIATAVNKASVDKKMLEETMRHNKAMEMSSGKGVGKTKGKGLYIGPYKWYQKKNSQ